VHGRFGNDFHERRAGAIVIHQRFARKVVQLAHVLLEMNACQGNFFMLAHHIPRRAGQFDFDLAAETDRLVVLRDLIVLRGVGIKIVFPVPFAHRRNPAFEHEPGLDDRVERSLVHHRKHARECQDDGIRERIGFVAITGCDAREHLRPRLDLDVNLKADDRFVVHLEVVSSE